MGETGEVQLPVSTLEKPKRQPSSRNLKRKFSAGEDESPLANNSTSLRRSLRRGSSFTFLTPGHQWDFSLKRKRREKDDSDAVSLCSFDFKQQHDACVLFLTSMLTQEDEVEP